MATTSFNFRVNSQVIILRTDISVQQAWANAELATVFSVSKKEKAITLCCSDTEYDLNGYPYNQDIEHILIEATADNLARMQDIKAHYAKR